jgi:hypothetical protein
VSEDQIQQSYCHNRRSCPTATVQVLQVTAVDGQFGTHRRVLNQRPIGDPAIPYTSVLGTMISLGARGVVTATRQFAYQPSGIAAFGLAVRRYGRWR